MRLRRALLASAFLLTLPVLAAEPPADEIPCEYAEWVGPEEEEREDTTRVQPTIHPGPETEGRGEDNVSPGLWQAVAEFLGEVLSGSAPAAADSGPSGRPRGF